MKVLIQDGKVHEIFGDVVPELHPDLLVVDADSSVQVGNLYSEGSFMEAPSTELSSEILLNRESQAYLTETDWYLTRKFETGVAVPQEILIKRQEAREAIV